MFSAGDGKPTSTLAQHQNTIVFLLELIDILVAAGDVEPKLF